MLHFLKELNTSQCVQYLIDCYRGCLCAVTLGVYGWSIIDVNLLHNRGIQRIAHVKCTILV